MTKPERMYSVVEAWQRSGVGKHKYAAQIGMAYATLQYWCKRYRERDQPAATPKFVALAIPEPSQDDSTHAQIVIVLPSGARIEVR